MSLKVNYRPHRAHLFINCLNLFIWGTYQYWDILHNILQEKFKDSKEINRNQKLMDRQYNGQNGVRVMVFNTIFNNISAISWRSVLLVEETRVPRENHWPVPSHWQTLLSNVVSSTPRLSRIWTHNIRGDRHLLHR
jgi:hypothetical protein